MPQKKKKLVKEDPVLELLKAVRNDQDKIATSVEGLRLRVIDLEEGGRVLAKKKEEDKPKQELQRESVRQPIPEDYKDIVRTILGEEFGIQMEYFKDKPEFMFTIVVPKEYSDMSDKEYTERGADLRSKIIPYAEGVNGVRMWCEAVKTNLAKTAQTKIK